MGLLLAGGMLVDVLPEILTKRIRMYATLAAAIIF